VTPATGTAQESRRPLALALAVAGLLWTSRALDRLAPDPFGGGWVAALLAGVGLLLAAQRARVRALLRHGWPLLLPVALALASTLWALKPRSTLRDAAGLAVATGFGIWLAARFDARSQVAIAALAGAALAASALAVVVGAPQIGIMSGLHEGVWQGPFWTRNRLAPVASLGALACALAARLEPRARAPALAGLALCLGVLLGSRSRSAALALAGCGLAFAGVAGIRRLPPARRARAAAAAAALGLALGALVLAHADALLAPLDRDATLSDRTRIWSLSLEAAAERPWLGHGYRGFWRRAPASAQIGAELGYHPYHSHNGLVELGLELGLAGVLAAAIPFAVFSARAAQRAASGAEGADAWPLCFLALFAAWNAVEPLAFRPAHCFTVLYAAAALAAVDPAGGRSAEIASFRREKPLTPAAAAVQATRPRNPAACG
jgi:O-antigen ligase